MSDIELVIKIPEEIYRNYKKVWQKRRGSIPESCIAFGIPLPKGYWISGHKETGALGITYTEKICSNCGWNHSLVIPKNYCPNCGAKMTESEEA